MIGKSRVDRCFEMLFTSNPKNELIAYITTAIARNANEQNSRFKPKLNFCSFLLPGLKNHGRTKPIKDKPANDKQTINIIESVKVRAFFVFIIMKKIDICINANIVRKNASVARALL